MKQIERLPFFRLLLPLLAGIVLQYYFLIHKWSIIALPVGLAIMLFSYFITPKKQFELRWLYGVGLFLFLFSVGSVSTLFRQELSTFTFIDANKVYKAVISDIPQEKPNTIACKIEIKEENKKIICYLPKDHNSRNLNVGDNISFFSKIEPFKRSQTHQNFNYATYIKNKGYAGYTFVQADRWEKTDEKESNIFIFATHIRQKILTFYKSLDLSNEEYGILSALTLGYKDSLSDDTIQSFRATGVAHILAVSGMHVGILYFILSTLLKTLPRKTNYIGIKQIVIILMLWSYAFIIGFPPSAIRACIMLTIYCISQIRGAKGYSLNTLFATGFLMLVWNPLWLYDLGFQLSFIAVLCLTILFPIANQYIYIKNRILRYFWNIFLMSIFIQIGTFPLCLYYFGTFPTYFFITNLLIIPLIVLTIYDSVLIFISSGLSLLLPFFDVNFSTIPIFIYKTLVQIITQIIYVFEKLPFAQLNNIYITLIQLLLLWSILVAFIYFIFKKKSNSLIYCLMCSFIFLCIVLHNRVDKKNNLYVYNNTESTNVTYYIGYNKHELTEFNHNKIINLNEQKYLILIDDIWKEKNTKEKFDLDYLHILGDNPISLYSVTRKFNVKKIILDGTLSRMNIKRLILECENLRIPYYDLSENEVLRIFF